MIKEIIPKVVNCIIDDKGLSYIDITNSKFNFSAKIEQRFKAIIDELISLKEYDGIYLPDDNTIFIENKFIYNDFSKEKIERDVDWHSLMVEDIKLQLQLNSYSIPDATSFSIKPKIISTVVASGEICGRFYVTESKIYVLNKDIARAIDYIREHKNKGVNDIDNNWKLIGQLKDINSQNINFDKILNQQEVLYCEDKVGIMFEIEDNSLLVNIKFPELSIESNKELNNKIFTQPFVSTVYSTINKSNGKKIRYIIPKEKTITLQAVKKKPILTSKEDMENCFRDLDKVYGVGFKININELSERVIGFGILDEHIIDSNNDQNTYAYPIELELYDQSNSKITKIIINADDRQNFIKSLKKSIELNQSFFIVDKHSVCPFTSSNLSELKKVVNLTPNSKTIQTKYLELFDKQNNKLLIFNKYNRSIAIDVSKIIKGNTQDLESLDYLVRAEYIEDQKYDKQIPLSITNLQNIFASIKTGLILDQAEYGLNFISDILLLDTIKDNTVKIPTTLTTKLKDHQLDGLLWLQNTYKLKQSGYNYSGVLLADDMGLGKTLQVLSFLEYIKQESSQEQTSLVVAPLSLIKGWEKEYKQFFSSKVKILVLEAENIKKFRISENNGRETNIIPDSDQHIKINLNIDAFLEYDLIITNYDTLKNYQYSFATIDWNIVVLDEAQEIKNPSTIISHACTALKSNFKIAMSGTPVENSLIDLWSIFNFLEPTTLPPLQQYKKMISNNSSTEESISLIHQYVKYKQKFSYILRRNKVDVLKDLPKKIIIDKPLIPFNKNILDEYVNLKNKFFIEDSLAIISKMQKLHQSFELYENRDINQKDVQESFLKSNKIKQLLKIIEDIKNRGEKVLIFAIFKQVQSLLKIILEAKFKN